MIIAVDGFSSTGKSSVSKGVASRLGIIYCNTGIMFRALAHALITYSINKTPSSINEFLKKGLLQFFLSQEGFKIFLNNVLVNEKELKNLNVTSYSTEIAKIPLVRDFLKEIQLSFAREHKNILFEGRDIGSIVFPQADFKFFLKADLTIRAERRYQELINQNIPVSLEEISTKLYERDLNDMTRTLAPLVCSKDAFVIDTSYLTLQQVIEQIYELINKGEKNVL